MRLRRFWWFVLLLTLFFAIGTLGKGKVSWNSWVIHIWPMSKVIYPKYSKHWPYTVAHTIDCVCSKMLNHGLNHGLFLSIFKLIPCPIHRIVYVKAVSDLNFKAVLELPKTTRSAQTQKSISFIWILWSTLYVYFWRWNAQEKRLRHTFT